MAEDTSEKDRLAAQKIVRSRVGAAVLVTSVLLYLSYHYLPLPRLNLPTIMDRLQFTLRWQLPSVLVLLIAVINVGNKRFNSKAIDPLGKDQSAVEIPLRFLQNTLEQVVLSVFGQLILTTYLKEGQMKIIPLLVTVFVIARVLFYKGYHNTTVGHTGRAYGFAMTILPTSFMYMYCILCSLKEIVLAL